MTPLFFFFFAQAQDGVAPEVWTPVAPVTSTWTTQTPDTGAWTPVAPVVTVWS